jgi:hypothetical protein
MTSVAVQLEIRAIPSASSTRSRRSSWPGMALVSLTRWLGRRTLISEEFIEHHREA